MIVKYFAWLKNITNIEEEEINDVSIIDINTLKKFLLKKYPEFDKYINEDDFIRVAINLEYAINNESIKPNDEIAIFPPVSGG